ncbi:MAG: dTDP-glucose 4,6-dehydratase [bacterium]
MKILVTGGAGFMGSDYIRYVLEAHTEVKIYNFDKLTYCGNLANLKKIETDPRYLFVRGDIADHEVVEKVLKEFKPDAIVNFAAETHVDRSILWSKDFVETDIIGTQTLLEAVKQYKITKYLQVSTDEVYGSIEEGEATEESVFNPSSPYSASKAGADLLIKAYWKTYRTPAIITHSCNNYGWYQYPEKVIPLFITNLIENKQVPLYGDGKNVREWIFVRDHSRAVDFLLNNGKAGESYNIGTGHRISNIGLTNQLLNLLNLGQEMIKPVKDRAGHDLRYAVSCEKLLNMGWEPEYQFDQAIRETVRWYQDNIGWWRSIKSGDYQEYYKEQYINREKS